ncbi:Alpha/Beta hydrolase protein [Collybia nuda]|uniref:Alpha/Beta hydrolase protein n=1 Tax=Collybia nuda TaxID=64659 RepID=A0A9P5YFW0_9AGAR|nr:Alpha/Beta hydrolase protein [Collybia nuda]
MYASEKLMNFRWISKIFATHSTYVLSDEDLAPAALNTELSELGQFAELAYSIVPPGFLLQNFMVLADHNYPLEGYTALRGAIFVSSFKGHTAKLPGYVAYRPLTKQLVVAISGTSSVQQAYHDIRTLKHRHPSKRGQVHSGFWDLYKGVKPLALDGIRKGIEECDVSELCITGHSMGGSMAYLLCMDLLTPDNTYKIPLSARLRLKIVTFGAPRTGNHELVTYWQELLKLHRDTYGQRAVIEHSVKAYNDGVPALPPARFGFQHFSQEPLYVAMGRTYQVPTAESEHAIFTVSPPLDGELVAPNFPRGGHNYYNNRDIERLSRRLGWLGQAEPEKDGWEGRYRRLAHKHQA